MKEDNGSRDFPWWWLEFGEDIKESIVREVKEEAWLEVTWVATEPSYFVASYNPQHNVRLAQPFYETKVKDLDFTPSKECQEIKFVTKKEAETMNIRPNVAAFLKQYIV